MTPSCSHLRGFIFLSSAVHKSNNSRFYTEDELIVHYTYRVKSLSSIISGQAYQQTSLKSCRQV